MVDPTPVFAGLLAVYLLVSFVVRLDPRYPVGATVGLFLVAAGVMFAGAPEAANALAVDVFLLFAGSLALLAAEGIRARRRARRDGALAEPPKPPTEPASPG